MTPRLFSLAGKKALVTGASRGIGQRGLVVHDRQVLVVDGGQTSTA